MPNAAEIDTEACPPPKASYSLSDMRGKPLMPPSRRLVRKASRRPVMILWAEVWWPTSQTILSSGVSKT